MFEDIFMSDHNLDCIFNLKKDFLNREIKEADKNTEMYIHSLFSFVNIKLKQNGYKVYYDHSNIFKDDLKGYYNQGDKPIRDDCVYLKNEKNCILNDINVFKSTKDILWDVVVQTYLYLPENLKSTDLISYMPKNYNHMYHLTNDINGIIALFALISKWTESAQDFRQNPSYNRKIIDIIEKNKTKFKKLYRLVDQDNITELLKKNIGDTITFNVTSSTTTDIVSDSKKASYFSPVGVPYHRCIIVFKNAEGLNLKNFYRYNNHFKHEKEVILFGKFKIVKKYNKIDDNNFFQIIELEYINLNITERNNLITQIVEKVTKNRKLKRPKQMTFFEFSNLIDRLHKLC